MAEPEPEPEPAEEAEAEVEDAEEAEVEDAEAEGRDAEDEDAEVEEPDEDEAPEDDVEDEAEEPEPRPKKIPARKIARWAAEQVMEMTGKESESVTSVRKDGEGAGSWVSRSSRAIASRPPPTSSRSTRPRWTAMGSS